MTRRSLRRLIASAGWLVFCVSPALAAFDGYTRASDDELDRMRGGFEFNVDGQHLLMAFSLDQLTYINGELVSSMRLTPLGLSAVNPEPGLGQPLADAVTGQGVITLVQNGTGNAFTLPESLGSLTTVIQNTVNDQVISQLTVLNATLSLQTAAAAMRLDAALGQALATGLY